MNKERVRGLALGAAGVGIMMLGGETAREILSITQVTYMPAVQRCIEGKNVYGLQPYDAARAACLEEVGIREFTPVLDTLEALFESGRDE